MMNRLKRFLPERILVLLYNSLILPHLQYSILCWGSKCSRISKLQKRALRTITCSKYNAHTEPIFKKLKLLKIDDIYKVSLLKFYHKYNTNKLPLYFKDFLSTPTHEYFTRGRENPIHGFPHTSFAENSVRNSLPIFLEETPDIVKDKVKTHSYQGCSQYFKNFLISNYKSICLIPNCYICSKHES